MPLQPVYLIAIKNLGPFLEALRHAQAPEKVALKFIEELGFKSTNDRLFLPLLKAMKFLDESGKPTARYHAFLDDEESRRVLAEGVRDAYADLFRINKNAHTFSREQLTGKLKSLGEGKLSPAVLQNMAKTFVELVKLADFAGASAPPGDAIPKPLDASEEEGVGANTDQDDVPVTPELLVSKDDAAVSA
ncbi:MAG: DUF5343 domain-containing protein [Planctomycetes bacterium]|nr:DUF5343 domain-containing protein [Planctomycetota bacterium]